MERKKEEGGKRIWIPNWLIEKIERMKVHWRQPYYEIIAQLLDEHERRENDNLKGDKSK